MGGQEWCSHMWFPWIKIDLGSLQTVIGVVIESVVGYYVTSIRVQTGFDVNSVQYILANDGEPKVSLQYLLNEGTFGLYFSCLDYNFLILVRPIEYSSRNTFCL